MGFKNFFSNEFSTSDHAVDQRLLTRYYRNDYKTTKEEILYVAKNLGFEAKGIDDKYQEILLEAFRKELIVTIVSMSYYEMAVDVKVTTHFILSMGRGIKIIDEFFNDLNTRLNFLRTGAK